jgi:hypothetical protein
VFWSHTYAGGQPATVFRYAKVGSDGSVTGPTDLTGPTEISTAALAAQIIHRTSDDVIEISRFREPLALRLGPVLPASPFSIASDGAGRTILTWMSSTFDEPIVAVDDRTLAIVGSSRMPAAGTPLRAVWDGETFTIAAETTLVRVSRDGKVVATDHLYDSHTIDDIGSGGAGTVIAHATSDGFSAIRFVDHSPQRRRAIARQP